MTPRPPLAENVEREDRLQAVDSASDGYWDLDVPAQKVHYSPRWKALFGYAEDEIEVESTGPTGSTFSFTADFGVQDRTDDVLPAVHGLVDKGRQRALIVDDNEIAREILESYLRELGLRVDSAASGEAAIELLGRSASGQTSPTISSCSTGACPASMESRPLPGSGACSRPPRFPPSSWSPPTASTRCGLRRSSWGSPAS
jgi:hypothetical protein